MSLAECIRSFFLYSMLAFSLGPLANVAEAKEIYSGVFGTWGVGKDQAFQAAKDNGFDVVISSDVAKTKLMGLKCFYPFSLTKEIAADRAQWEGFVANVAAVVKRYKGDPTVFGWYLADEPDWNNIPPSRYKELNSIIKWIDPSKPTLVVLTIPTKWSLYLPYFDIIAIDPYLPNTHTGTEVDKVRNWIDLIYKDFRKVKVNKPLWVVLGAFEQLPKNGTKPAFRKPTPEEFQEMLQTCLIRNISGILIFSLSKDERATYYGWNLMRDDPNLWEIVRKTPQIIRSRSY